MNRRSFLGGVVAGAALPATAQNPGVASVPQAAWSEALALPASGERTWLGPAFWANRLQDWRLANGRIECVAAGPGDEIRTVALLTREMTAEDAPAHLRVTAGLTGTPGEGGFCGFLVGTGAGRLDWRAAALVHKASGTGGGLMAVFDTAGRAHFREHTDEERPLAFADVTSQAAPPAPGVQAFQLRLDILPQGNNRFELRLSVLDESGSRSLTNAARRDVPGEELLGGIALVSSPAPRLAAGASGARWWFRDVRTAGAKIAVRAERALGPILGTLHSLNGRNLKMTAQLTPVGAGDPRTARFEYRAPLSRDWNTGPEAPIEPGFIARFRITKWDPAREWEYRIVYAGSDYAGIVRADPGTTRPLTIGLFSCVLCVARSLDGGPAAFRSELPQSEPLGRFTDKNIYYPHKHLVENSARHQPDLLVFAGDQIYEGNPTRRDPAAAPTLDYLYKWYLWTLSFRELTRSTPSIVMVDDHDVYHGNIWGNGGRLAPERDQNRGGYRCTGDFVNIVQNTQCGHNPDTADPAPVDQNIGVYFGAFRFGGTSFAVLEDRKFKTAPIQGGDLDVHESELLGERQERFLEAWGAETAALKVCLTQTLLGCLQTSPSGSPLQDFDANGYPKPGRDKAVSLLKKARALVLAGDQHLASLVRHGVDTYTDGVLQFTGPAGGSSWQRWFEPAKPLANARAANTGDFIDAFGNKMRVLAIANPKVSFVEYRKHIQGRGQGLGDRRLKSEGYCIIRIDHARRDIVLECWPWNVNPQMASSRQFDGWPVRVAFSDL